MNNYLKYKFLVVLMVSFFGLLSFFNKADALTLTPVRFEISGNPGDSITEEIILMNETESTATYYSSFSNFEAQGESGNPAFTQPKDGLGTWISTDNSVTIAPGKSVNIPFTVRIPTDADAGGHFAVIFFGDSPEFGSDTVSVGSKAGVLVLLSVSGEVKEAGGVTTFNTKNNKFFYNTLPVDFEYKFKNDGNDRIKPVGKVTIRNTVFLPSARLDGNPIEGNILPGSTRKFELTWVKSPRPNDYVAPTGFISKFVNTVGYQWKNFAFGLYSAHLKLSYGINNSMANAKSTYFFVFPWQLLLVLGVLISIIFFGGKKLLKRYNNYIIEKARAGMHLPHSASHDK